MRILLAEDDAMLGDGLRTGLRQLGFQVDWVRDGVAAERELASGVHAAAVLDLGLPYRDGMEVLATRRQRKISTPRPRADRPRRRARAGARTRRWCRRLCASNRWICTSWRPACARWCDGLVAWRTMSSTARGRARSAQRARFVCQARAYPCRPASSICCTPCCAMWDGSHA